MVSTDNEALNDNGSTVRLDGLGELGAWEFEPEPGTVLLLGSGLMGLAGYAGLRLKKN
jgi:hypothetical protein